MIKKKAFFDIGPGVLNSEAWHEMWKDYTIIGLEPDLERFDILVKEYPGMLLPLGISDVVGDKMFAKHSTSGYIADGYPGIAPTHRVSCLTLDMLDALHGPFDEIAIWADIEGSELKMLKGAENVLKKTNWITLELHTNPKTEEWANSHEIYEYLEERGFIPDILEKEKTEIDFNYDVIFTKNGNN